MGDKHWLKILVCTVLIGILLFAGFIGALITAFSGGVKFYTPLVLTATG